MIKERDWEEVAGMDERDGDGIAVGEDGDGKRGIQSMEIGIQILQAILNGHRGMMLKEIASAVGMPPSKVHRYLVSMVRTGLAQQESGTRYDLGPLALNIGLVAADRLDRIQAGTKAIAELWSEIGQTTALATWSPSGPIVVRSERAPGPVAVSVSTGSALNMLTTVSGRIFGAYLPRDKCRHLIEEELKSSDLPEELRSSSAVEAMFEDIRQHGLSIVERHHVPSGVSAAGAPVFNSANQISLVVAAVGFEGRLDLSLDGRVTTALKATALKLSRRLGYMGEAAGS
jgi:DNA-binding IclR family transcriptional regulator